MMEFVAFVTAMAALVSLCVWLMNRRNRPWSRKTTEAVGNMIRPAMRLWAGHAPFKDGNMSRLFLEAAYRAVLGKDQHAALWAQETFLKHAESFDQDQSGWNKIAADLLASEPRPSEEARQKLAESLLFVMDFQLFMKWTNENRDLDNPAVVEQCKNEKEVLHMMFANVAEETK